MTYGYAIDGVFGALGRFLAAISGWGHDVPICSNQSSDIINIIHQIAYL